MDLAGNEPTTQMKQKGFPKVTYSITRGTGNTSKCIADIVSQFITLMDKLQLNLRANDELQPELRDLADSMARLSLVPDDFEGKVKVNQWLRTLSAMQASDELSEGQVRQLLFDLDTSYNAFNRLLHQ